MLEAVKMPLIRLSYANCDDVVIGRLVNSLKSEFQRLTIIVTPESKPAEKEGGLSPGRDAEWWGKLSTPGKLLWGIRLKHELTQKELSRLSGISHATISAYEHDKRPLSWLAASRLANAMGEDPASFFDHIEKK